MTAPPRPTALTYRRAERVLDIAFDDGARFALPAELLRVESPSAEVRGHGGPRQIVPGKRTVAVDRIEPVGNYAVRLVFSDGHDSGLYSWPFLYRLGQTQAEVWQAYEQALATRGLSRDTPAQC